MKSGLCYLVILDDGTLLKHDFVAMWKALDVNYDILAKRNHKSLIVKHFHRLINIEIIIAMENLQNNDIFFPTEIAT